MLKLAYAVKERDVQDRTAKTELFYLSGRMFFTYSRSILSSQKISNLVVVNLAHRHFQSVAFFGVLPLRNKSENSKIKRASQTTYW